MHITRGTAFLPREWAGLCLSNAQFRTDPHCWLPLVASSNDLVPPYTPGSWFSPFYINALLSYHTPSCMALHIYHLSSVGLFLPGKRPIVWHTRSPGKTTLLSATVFYFYLSFQGTHLCPVGVSKTFFFYPDLSFPKYPGSEVATWNTLTPYKSSILVSSVIDYSNLSST